MNDLWSAAKEKNLTILKDICFYSGCAFLLALIASAIMTRWELMLYMVGACIFTFGIGTLAVAQIDSMKANRPVGGPAAKLTDWRFWPFYQSAFDCKCGRRLTFAGVPITPNTVDGGRHCVLCPDCGQGHYKNAEVGTIVTGHKVEPAKPKSFVESLEPWTLACAVGAMNGSIYGAVGSRGAIGFDSWVSIANKNQKWSRADVESLRTYANQNAGRHMNEVLHSEEQARGYSLSTVIGSGETITFEMPLAKPRDKQ